MVPFRAVGGTSFFYRHVPRLVFQLRRLARANYEQEMELLDLLCDRTRSGIDVGAKVGMYSYRIRKYSADVIVFEPIPLFNQMLRAVFAGRRGRVEPVAVSSTCGRVTMRLPLDAAGGHEFYGRSTIEPSNALTYDRIAAVQEIEVETRTLDSYEFPSVGFIKIDVEGHELAVLEGAVQTIARHRPNLLIECNDDHTPDGVARLGAWLRANDYEAFFVAGNTVHDIAAHDRAEHWLALGIENFICVHRTRGDVRTKVAARVSTRAPLARANVPDPVSSPSRR